MLWDNPLGAHSRAATQENIWMDNGGAHRWDGRLPRFEHWYVGTVAE